jgi:hypothetical protein
MAPKKNFVNEKQLAGRARKEAAAQEKELQKVRAKEEIEARTWEIGTKDTSKQRELEAKRLQKAQAKAERKDALEKEEGVLGSKNDAKSDSGSKGQTLVSEDASSRLSSLSIDGSDISEDEQGHDSGVEGIADRHLGRRAKVAYAAFEDRELPLLKKQFTSLRLSQLKALLWKKWQKSSENPFNQPRITRSASADLQDG